MKQELEKIGLSLREWCMKYNKHYVTMFVFDGNIHANVDTEDIDAKDLDLFIEKEEK